MICECKKIKAHKIALILAHASAVQATAAPLAVPASASSDLCNGLSALSAASSPSLPLRACLPLCSLMAPN